MVTCKSENQFANTIDGFKYNKFDCCLNPIIAFERKGKVQAQIRVARAQRGWAEGIREDTHFTHAGAGGSAYGVWWDARDQYATQQDAAIAAAYMLVRVWENEKKIAPAAASREYQKAIDELKAFIGEVPAPNPLPYQEPPTNPKQPLQYQLF